MAVTKIQIEQFIELARNYPVLDVRSPAEFKHAHIPGAFNLPLFSDEERKIVGTNYKQKSREAAIKVGLEFFGPKMKSIVEEAERIVGSRKQEFSEDLFEIENHRLQTVLIHCWRGGMRSEAIAWLLDLYGFQVFTLAGGYKLFRNYVLDSFKFPYTLKVLGGFTGSGKTELLHALKSKGEKVIDLEDLAKHKGSAFGNIGMPEQPGQEMFENLLAVELRALTNEDSSAIETIWVEDESQRIGLVNIPNDLWKTMRNSPVFFLDIPFDIRLDHVVKEYGQLDKDKLINAIQRISQKLGHQNAQNAVRFLEEGNIRNCFGILLSYYDRFYLKALHNRESVNTLLRSIRCSSITPENANQLADSLQTIPEKV